MVKENSLVWLVVKTRPRQEERARENLERQGFQAYLPKFSVKRRLRGKWRSSVEPLFPGYLFIYINPEETSLSPIHSTLGVSDLVRFGHQLVPVPESVIEYLRQRESEPADAATSLFSHGKAVDVLEGPFAGLPAIYQVANGADRATIMITLLGRKNSVSVPFDSIAPSR